MKNLVKRIKKSKDLVNNERGQGMLEYILLVVVIVGLVIAAKGFLGDRVEDIKGEMATKIGDVLGGQ
jgi:Flp pilus assembly pilin Flp